MHCTLPGLSRSGRRVWLSGKRLLELELQLVDIVSTLLCVSEGPLKTLALHVDAYVDDDE